jgi:ribosomal protein L29
MRTAGKKRITLDDLALMTAKGFEEMRDEIRACRTELKGDIALERSERKTDIALIRKDIADLTTRVSHVESEVGYIKTILLEDTRPRIARIEKILEIS